MDELEKLVEQVKILAQTNETMIARAEQLFKLQTDQSQMLHQVAEDLKQAIESLAISDEALKRSLSESDQGIDDIAEIVAGLLMLKKEQEQPEGAPSGV